MSSPRITFNYSSRSATDPWWVRLEQEDLPDDTATLSDAANLLDTLYNLDPCSEDETTETVTDPSTADVEETVEITVDRMACEFDADGNIDVTLQVIRSRQDAPYKLALSGGRLLTTETITEPYSQIVLVENASSITLDYPVIDDFTAAWSGTVYGEYGRLAPPPINRIGNTLDFNGAAVAAGSIIVSYLTEYDRCTVTINGIDGEPGACTARVFFHGLVDELELEIPEASEPLASCTARWRVAPFDYDIECYQMVTVSTRCQCSDHEVSSRTYEETVDCPDSVVRCQGVETECRHLVGSITVPEYVECTDDNEVTGRPGMIYSLSTEKYYEDHCCKPPGFPLPDCPEKKISHRGGMPLSGGAAQYRNIYGPKLRIVPVSPPGGICGDWTIRQEVISSNCCDGVDPLSWDESVSPEVMTPNSAVIVGVTGGGRYPYEWTVDGEGFQFQATGSKIARTTGNKIYLSALPTACGTAVITVTDGCSSATGYVRSTNGVWVGGCRRIFVIESATRNDTWIYRSTIGLSDDGCYGVEIAGPYGWDNPEGLPWLAVQHWLQVWNGSTWVPYTSEGGAIWGADVLASDWQALLAAVTLPVTRVADTYTPPDGSGAAYACGGLECAWRCV